MLLVRWGRSDRGVPPRRADLLGLNGGPQFTFSEAISLPIMCGDQDEVDRYWARLIAGGEEEPCGWLKDRFGVSWQFVPTAAQRADRRP